MKCEDLSILQLLRRMKISQIVGLMAFLLSLISGGFTVGVFVQSIKLDREKFELINKVKELEDENKRLRDKPVKPGQPIKPCASAKIVSPIGSQDEVSARNFVVPKNFRILWEPPDCIMDVEYWNGTFNDKFKNVTSGDTINISHSGATKLKIWYAGEIPHSIWVFVK